MPIYSGFSHEKLSFSIAMLVYQRVNLHMQLISPHLMTPGSIPSQPSPLPGSALGSRRVRPTRPPSWNAPLQHLKATEQNAQRLVISGENMKNSSKTAGQWSNYSGGHFTYQLGYLFNPKMLFVKPRIWGITFWDKPPSIVGGWVLVALL